MVKKALNFYFANIYQLGIASYVTGGKSYVILPHTRQVSVLCSNWILHANDPSLSNLVLSNRESGRKNDLMRSESSRQPFTNSSLVNSPSPLMSSSLKIFLARSAALSWKFSVRQWV